MTNLPRNFPALAAVYIFTVFALRSLQVFRTLTEIPGRFSSSSLPPSFASGRFAVFCFPGQTARGV
jgi:hypothetical protein